MKTLNLFFLLLICSFGSLEAQSNYAVGGVFNYGVNEINLDGHQNVKGHSFKLEIRRDISKRIYLRSGISVLNQGYKFFSHNSSVFISGTVGNPIDIFSSFSDSYEARIRSINFPLMMGFSFVKHIDFSFSCYLGYSTSLAIQTKFTNLSDNTSAVSKRKHFFNNIEMGLGSKMALSKNLSMVARMGLTGEYSNEISKRILSLYCEIGLHKSL